jgi:riboflavin synthase
MFTGIIECLGIVKNIKKIGSNLNLWIESEFTKELKVDQSVSHNGICLTVVEINDNQYLVTAIEETILKTTIKHWQVNDLINLERGLKLGDRLDGHIVQGHVDEVAICTDKAFRDGSWCFTFAYNKTSKNITIEKGSITINGISLTVVNALKNSFEVHIIPYTYEHTNIKNVGLNDEVNLEFDVIGKYVTRLNQLS